MQWPLRILLPALLTGLAARSLLTVGSGDHFRPLLSHHTRSILRLLAMVGAGYLGSTLSHSLPDFALWLACAVGAGFLSHLLADTLMSGVPLLWPLMPSPEERGSPGHPSSAWRVPSSRHDLARPPSYSTDAA